MHHVKTNKTTLDVKIRLGRLNVTFNQYGIGTSICYRHLVSNMGEWNNCFIKLVNRLDDVDISVCFKLGDSEQRWLRSIVAF